MLSGDDRELQQWMKQNLHDQDAFTESEVSRIVNKALHLIHDSAEASPAPRSNLVFARAALLLILCGMASLATLLISRSPELTSRSTVLDDRETLVAVDSHTRFTTDPEKRQVRLDRGEVHFDSRYPTTINTRYGDVYARNARFYVLCSPPSKSQSALTVVVVSGQVKVSNAHGMEQGEAGDVIFAKASTKPKKDATAIPQAPLKSMPDRVLQAARERLDQAIKVRATAFADSRHVAQIRQKMRAAQSIAEKKQAMNEYRQALRQKHEAIRQAVHDHHAALRAYSLAWRKSRSRNREREKPSDRKVREASQAIRDAQQAWRDAVHARNAYRRKVGASRDEAVRRHLQNLEKKIEQARLAIKQAQNQWHQAVQERNKPLAT